MTDYTEEALSNYTEINEDFFDEIYSEFGNKDCVLKIIDRIEYKHPKYYAKTSFLLDEEDDD